MIKGGDGVFRWTYEMNMWKNPTILITVGKVILLSAQFPALLIFFLSLEDGFSDAARIMVNIEGIILAIFFALLLIAYPVIALMNGGKYCVVFEMDEKGIKHIQMDKQFKKAQVLSMLTFFTGVLTRNPTGAATGLLAATKNSMYSRFSKVRSVKIREKRNVIYLNEFLNHNQVYCSKEDFDFVKDYILSHTTQSKTYLKATGKTKPRTKTDTKAKKAENKTEIETRIKS